MLPLKIGPTPPRSFETRTRSWSRHSNALTFDLGDQRGHLFGDCDPETLMSWVGDGGDLKALSVSLGEFDGTFSRPGWIVLHFYDGRKQRFQSAKTAIGAGRVERVELTERPVALRISLRIEGAGTFRAIPIHLRAEAGAPDEAAPVKCLMLQAGAGAPPWLEAVPDDLRDELRNTAIRTRVRSAVRLWTRLANEVEVAQQLLPSDLSKAGGDHERWQAVESAADATLVVLSAARQALTSLEKQAAQAVAGIDEPGEASNPGDLARVSLPVPARAELAARAAELAAAGGLSASVATCLNNAHPGDQPAVLEALGEQLALIDPSAATRAFWLSWTWKPTPQRATSVAAKMFKAGDIRSAGRLLERGDPDRESTLTRALKAAIEIERDGIAIPPRAPARSRAVDDLAYVVSAAQPFQTTGYTVRSQELLSSLRRQGLGLTCYVRPGYPFPELLPSDEGNALAERFERGIIPYVLTEPGSLVFTEGYFAAAAAALVRRFTERPPRLVQAASNHRNALPALIAARTVGVPFVYELRGLWELTAASKNPQWEATERFAQERRLELTVAAAADQVLTITQGVADELIASGIERERIALLPNGVDPETFKPAPFDASLAAALGSEPGECIAVYAGSLANYEGLDDVVSAIGLLRGRGVPARLVVVGDGAMRSALEEQAEALGLQRWVHFAGSVPPDQVARYISIAGMIPIARKPFKVCEVVSPLKPFEAMAMEKPVIVSNLAALREIVTDGETGLICAPADPESLADAMSRLHASPELSARIGRNAREWIVAHRSWDRYAAELSRLYDRLRSDA